LKVIARIAAASATFAALMVATSPSYAQPTFNVSTAAATVQKTTVAKVANVSDAALVKSFSGFRNGYAEANGVRLHYVVDVVDNKGYGTLQMPVLALGGPAYGWMKKVVGQKAANLTAVNVENSGHFIQEEQPEFVTRTMVDFLRGAQ
jgi:pimeloyl-ACP methyl ester carboxylesterase